MGNTILYNTAGSIALAINYETQGPYNDKFASREDATTVRLNAELYMRVDDAVFCIEDDVDLTAADLDAGSSFDASDTYYIYACHPLDGTQTPVFKISKNATYPSGGWTADTSRKIGGFETDGAGDITVGTLWDLRTEDATLVASATTETEGKIAIATPAETLAMAAGDKAVPPSGLEQMFTQYVNQLSNPFLVNSQSTLANSGVAIAEDDMADDDTAGWTTTGSGSLVFDTDHYEYSNSAGNIFAYLEGISLELGVRYLISADLKDGSAAGAIVKGYQLSSAGGVILGPAITTTADWKTYTWSFEGDSNRPLLSRCGLSIISNLAGNNIEIKNFTAYEASISYTGADTKAPDGMEKTGNPKLYIEENDFTHYENGQGMKGVTATPNDYFRIVSTDIYDKSWFLAKMRGRTLTLRVPVFCEVGSAVHIAFAGDVSGSSSSGYHPGTGGIKYLTVSHTFSETDSYASILLTINAACDWYVSPPSLVFGSHCTQHTPRPGEKIISDTTIALADYAADAVAADATINLVEQTSGKLPAGMAMVHGVVTWQNTAAGKYLKLYSESGGVLGCTIISQVASQDISMPFSCPCDVDGNIFVAVEDGNGTATIKINAVTMR